MNATRTGQSGSSAWERLVALLPAACAVHCVMTPFLAAAVPVLAFGPTGEWVALGACGLLAVLAVRVTSRVHRVRWVWLLVAAGIATWALGIADVTGSGGEREWIAGAGGLVMAVGVVWSSRLRHRKVCAGAACVV